MPYAPSNMPCGAGCWIMRMQMIMWMQQVDQVTFWPDYMLWAGRLTGILRAQTLLANGGLHPHTATIAKMFKPAAEQV
eukprot:2825336-Pyramimonas_sp.AAC.1